MRFGGVRVSVDNGVVTLSGSVDRCLARLDAVQMTSRIRGVRSIADKIQVTGPQVPDAQLKAHLEKSITERIRKLGGFGFGSIPVKVRDGEVTLSGDAAKQLAGPAVAAAAETLGVKG
jgi:hyperosmotically inducible protein